jgi:hypothetical protein
MAEPVPKPAAFQAITPQTVRVAVISAYLKPGRDQTAVRARQYLKARQRSLLGSPFDRSVSSTWQVI